MGAKLPDTPAMKRGRFLEEEVSRTVGMTLGKKIENCGLFLSKKYPMIAGSPDGISGDCIIEIKCPMSEKTYQNYIKNGNPTKKFYAQVQMQMYLSGLKKCFFCVADANFTSNKKVEIIQVTYDENYMSDFLEKIITFWKSNVYTLLYKSIE